MVLFRMRLFPLREFTPGKYSSILQHPITIPEIVHNSGAFHKLKRLISAFCVVVLLLSTACTRLTPLEKSLGLTTYDGPKPEFALTRLGRGQTTGLHLSPDDQYLAVTTTIGLTVYSASPLAKQWQLAGYGGPLQAAAYSPDGTRIVAAVAGEPVYIRKSLNGRRILELTGYDGNISRLTYSAGGTDIIAFDGSQPVAAWNAETGEPIIEVPLLNADPTNQSRAGFLAEGLRLSINPDNSIELYDSADSLLYTLIGHTSEPEYFAVNSEQTLLYSASKTMLIVWNLESGEPLYADDSFGIPLADMSASSSASTLATLSVDGEMALWDGVAGQRTRILEGHAGIVTDITFTPDSQALASVSDDGSLIIWDVDRSGMLQNYQGGIPLNAVAFGLGGKLIAAAGDGAVLLWREEQGLEEPTEFDDPAERFLSVAFPPDSTQLAAGTERGTLVIWGVDSEAIFTSVSSSGDAINDLEYAPDGNHILTLSEGRAAVWSISGDSIDPLFNLDAQNVSSIDFSVDDRLIVTGLQDGSIMLWDAATGEEVNILSPAHADIVNSTVFTQDGVFLVTGSADGTVILWEMEEILPDRYLLQEENE